jgi:aldose 1-epimerase
MKYSNPNIFLLVILFLVNGIHIVNGQNSKKDASMLLKAEDFQKNINGKNVNLYFLKNGNMNMAITNYGARIVSLCVPDKYGQMADVVVGFKSIDDYLKATGVYHGAIIGRVAGRIKNGKINVNDSTYSLQLNAGNSHLHGGSSGFHNQVWNVQSNNDTSLVLAYFSKEGEMGYPGNVTVEVAYTLNSKNELTIEYKATTDKGTPLNLTNHAFFNLAGEGSGSIYNHLLTINANYICPIDEAKIAIAKNYKVKSTPLDFRKEKAMGKDLIFEDVNQQLKLAGGYDHHYVLNRNKKNKIMPAATVVEPNSGRKMEVFSQEPCIHFFSANFFKGTDIGKMGKPINYRESFALETQRYPYSSDSKLFPSIILNPTDKYETKTTFRFSIVE